jgi:hypothetical protein
VRHNCGLSSQAHSAHGRHADGSATADGIIFMVERDVAVDTGQIEDVEAVIAVWREPKVTSNILLKAKANGAWAAARGANELLAKLTGHLVEKCDMRVIRGFEDLSDEELRALASEEAQGGRH